MIDQVAGLRERHAEGDAGEGTVAGMGVYVSRQAAGCGEGQATSGACACAVAGMSAHALRQVAGPADQHSVTGVHSAPSRLFLLGTVLPFSRKTGEVAPAAPLFKTAGKCVRDLRV